MTAEELIQSGMLEAHVMGQLAGEEARLVERMRLSDPGVRAELEAIEEALERQAMAGAVPPPAAIRTALMDRIKAEGRDHREVPVRSIEPRASVDARPWRWLAAAAMVALVVSAALNVMTFNELRSVRTELARLENDRSVLAEELQVHRASLERTQGMLAVMTDPRTDIVLLTGTDNAPDAKARVYWDRDRDQVFIDVLKLPEPPQGQQYQLWALVDGQPLDAGVFGMGDDAASLQAMKAVPGAQAFAVTLEREGGSPVPTLEAMVLIGQV